MPDQEIALVDLIMLIEEKCEWPDLCNRIVFRSKAAGGVRPIGLLFVIVRVQCKLRRIESEVCEHSSTDGFFCATHARDVERCVWEQAARSEWATTVRTRFPVRQLMLLLRASQAARHVELDGVAGDELRACAFSPTLLQLVLVGLGALSEARIHPCRG